MSGIRRIFYDKTTGERIVEDGYNGGMIIPTIEQVIATYTALSERNRNTFDVLELDYGAYSQDFSECNGYRVNVETKALEFSYPDPNNNNNVELTFKPPLSEKVEQLEARLNIAQEVIDFLLMGGE